MTKLVLVFVIEGVSKTSHLMTELLPYFVLFW